MFENTNCALRGIFESPAYFSLGVVSGFRRGFRSREAGGCLPSRCLASSRLVATSNLGLDMESPLSPSFRLIACAFSSALHRHPPVANFISVPFAPLTGDGVRERDVA